MPGKRPTNKTGWNNIPKKSGEPITKSPGKIISFKEALVDTSIQLS